MATPDTLRHTRIPLADESGAIPALGFGTLIPDPLATKQATKTALEVGFRHFDCAERYRNEQAVGDAMQEVIKAGTIQRKDIFVTTKLWNNNHRPDRVKPAFEASRQRLQLDYVDCYLMHTPFAFQPGDEQDPRDERGQVIYDTGVTLVETWQALERLVDEGRCKSIGLSDTSLEKVQEIVKAARIKPAVVQVEAHPYLPPMGAARLLSAAWNCTARICGVRTRDGTQITGKSGDHRYRAARWQNPRPNRARLGYTTWHSPPDHLDHAPLHPGELRGLPSAGRRDARDPGWHHDEGPVQCGG